MKRRKFIAILGGMAATWPVPAGAQQADAMRSVGVLVAFSEDDPEAKARIRALLEGLERLGWTEGRNLHITYRWTSADAERMRVAAKELVALRPQLLIGITTPGTLALRHETASIPIIFTQVSDPVGSGLVSNLAKPDENITGFANFEFSIGGKWLETLKEVFPQLQVVGVMYNPVTAPYAKFFVASIESAAQTLGVRMTTLAVHDAASVDTVVANLAKERDGTLLILSDIFTTVHRDSIIAAAAKYHLPAIYPLRLFVSSGGLISYGVDTVDLYRSAAVYVDRILKGAKTVDLPVQQPTKFELAINLKTANILGLTVPPALLARADDVIE